MESPRPRAPDRRGRHELAVRQSLRWAELAAARGDYSGALNWLAAVAAVDGRLPDDWEERRRAWERAAER